MAGALAAIWGTRTLVALAPLDLPRREAIVVDWSIGAIVIGVGVLLGLIAATAPAMWAARASLSSLLAASAVRGGGGHGRMRRGMVVAQVALSFVLLSTGGLVVRSFERLLRCGPGLQSRTASSPCACRCRPSSSLKSPTSSPSRTGSKTRLRRYPASRA